MVSIEWDIISASNGKIILIDVNWKQNYRSWLFPLIHEFIHYLSSKFPYFIEKKIDILNDQLWLVLWDRS